MSFKKNKISARLCKQQYPIRGRNQKVHVLVPEYAKIQILYHCTMYMYGGSFYM